MLKQKPSEVQRQAQTQYMHNYSTNTNINISIAQKRYTHTYTKRYMSKNMSPLELCVHAHVSNGKSGPDKCTYPYEYMLHPCTCM